MHDNDMYLRRINVDMTEPAKELYDNIKHKNWGEWNEVKPCTRRKYRRLLEEKDE